uniref:hypothetical protein n=1 Tax=uncultured Sphingomonas sp. TaxID=158754 RepID=UPI0035CC606D
MSLSLEESLGALAETLRSSIVPALDDPFALEAARLAGQLLAIAAHAVDDAAALRVAENAAIRRLFAEAHGTIKEAGLAARLTTAAMSEGPGLKLSELDRENARLRSLLIEVHAYVERQAGAAAQELDHQIWRLLKDIEERRAPRL